MNLLVSSAVNTTATAVGLNCDRTNSSSYILPIDILNETIFHTCLYLDTCKCIGDDKCVCSAPVTFIN